MMNWKMWVIVLAVAIGAVGGVSSRLACADPNPAFNENLIRELEKFEQRGNTLTESQKALLARAKAERASTTAPQPPRESTGLIPLPDLTGEATYKGLDGGLYGGGSNEIPADHKKLALAAVAKIAPLDADGKPSSDGKIVLLAIGMSNTTMEFSRFKQLADADAAKNPKLVIVDGAQGGKDAAAWVNEAGGKAVWDEAARRTKAAGATDQQVQVVWIKQALIAPGKIGELPKHTDTLTADLVTILQLAQQRYPNLRVAYLSSRIYAGYATTALNPEPYAYEGGFAVRKVIQRQIAGEPALSVADGKAPVVLWGPYLWTDGTKGRKTDDVVWERDDVAGDGTHPSGSGRQKVAAMLLHFFQTDPTAQGWFSKPTP